MRDLAVLMDRERLQRTTRIVAGCYLLALVAIWATSAGNMAFDGRPLGADFITFWSAGRLTLAGNAAGAFDPEQIFAMQRMVVPGYQHVFLWHYPPTFQLLSVPLGLLPYSAAYYLFVGFSVGLFVLSLKPLVPWREAAVLLLALPATLICALHGQNSLLSAALLATAIMTIDRRPVLAGICIGLLAYKPQLGVLFPLVLAITGRWRVLFVAAATLAAFVGLSVAVFGVGLWEVFFRNLGVVREVVESGQLPWGKMPSAFVFMRMLGVSEAGAYAGQAIVALGAISVTALVWWRSGATLLAGAVLIAGTLLLTPYMFDYEMAILAVPLAIIARHLVRHGAGNGEKLLLLALAVSPLAMGPLAAKSAVQVGFLALIVTFAWAARLAFARKSALAGVIPGVRPAPMLAVS